MTPGDENILKMLNLLVLLSRAQKQPLSAMPEEKQGTLILREEHVKMSGLLLPAFINTLKILGDRGYLVFVALFEDKFRQKIAEYQKSDQFAKAMEFLKTKDTSGISLKLKESVAEDVAKIAPKNLTLDKDALMGDEFLTFENLLQAANDHILEYTPDSIATVALLPFRSIERLLERMNGGMTFDEVQDAGIWYDAAKYEFHYGERVLPTAYRGTPSAVHFIFHLMFNVAKDTVVDFPDVLEIDDYRQRNSGNDRYYDSMKGFLKKDPALRDIFVLHRDRLEIAEKYQNDTP